MAARRYLTISCAAAGLVLSSGALSTPDGGAAEPIAPPVAPATAVTVDLPVATSAVDAMSLALSGGARPVAVRFEQPGVVGEYFPQSAADLEGFESEFEENFGVSPAVVAVIVEVPSGSSSRSKSAGEADVRSEVLEADLPPIPVENATSPAVLEQFAAARARAQEAAAGTVMSRAAAAQGPLSWAPGYTEVYAATVGGEAKISTYSSWYDGGPDPRSPGSLDSDWGIEIDIVQANPDVRSPANTPRPACTPVGSFRDQYWAARDESTSSPFSGWTVSYPALIQDVEPAAIGAYADGDDLFDACENQSMAIGIGTPQNIPSSTSALEAGFYDLITNIYTRRGTQASSAAAGYIQAVSNDCNNLFEDPASSCMGLNFTRDLEGKDKTQTILRDDRGWTLPKCWSVANPEPPYEFPCDL